MSIVIARSRHRMFTAFITPAGRAVLNVADVVDDVQHCVSIELDDDDVDAMIRDEQSAALRVDQLLHSGTRLQHPLPTPSASIPVSGITARAA